MYVPYALRKTVLNLPSHAELTERLHYDQYAGTFTWTDSPLNKGFKYKPAGRNEQNAYPRFKINGVKYCSHVLAVYWMTGVYPSEGVDVDHIDRDPGNYKYANLRLLSRSENLQNTRLSIHNTSGFKCVYRIKGTSQFVVKTTLYGVLYNLGIFDTAEEASEHFNNWAKLTHVAYNDSRIV